MSDKVKFLMTFRARLMLLLTSFLLLTIALVLALDNWARKRAEEVISEQNKQVTESVNSGYDDFLEAMSLAQQALRRGRRLKVVAAEVGYGSEAALSRALRAYTGLSPRAWKQQLEAGAT